MKNPFDSAGMAAGYATSRPPVHPIVIEKVRRHLGISQPVECAIDVGCGAGLSTRPLASLARCAVGIEPAEPMLQWTAATAPGSHFVVGRAEELPFPNATANLLTAAGSLNYVADLDLSLAEARRVLAPGGTLVVYDFSQGRRFPDSPALEHWFTEFRSRYPVPTGSARPLDPPALARSVRGLEPAGHEYFEAAVPLDPAFYLDYVMTETNVAHAIRNGCPAGEIREWCAAGLRPVFAGLRREVMFDGYIAYFQAPPG